MDSGTVISFAALGMSAVSLAWRVASWRRSGPVVAVTAHQVWPVGDADHVGVTARNTGRAAVTVTGWGLRVSGGGQLVATTQSPWSKPLPHRLESHAEAMWAMPTEGVRQWCAELGLRHQDLHAFVHLANGRTIVARRKGIRL